ncbi:MAG TPA: class I SAM-dependent methyltransferase [Syntrophales bacterium]|nr:class I SAM-dependent methyltransferase [Syntrophales bacterium]
MEQWIYDEFKHCGVDYSKAELAEAYDERHQKFRDYEKEFKGMMEFLGIRNTENKIMIDLGCGTGATAILAAPLFKAVYAVDVSDVMIEQAKEKSGSTAHNLTFVNEGFLTYRHEDELADLVITKAAFHHLPDFWKQIALLQINAMLKIGGLLYIHDVVFHFDPRDYVGTINAWIAGFEKVAGEEFRQEVETHIRDEYSTFHWIVEGMLERAGFSIEKAKSPNDFLTEYACRKVR